jgi:hypothetical protein
LRYAEGVHAIDTQSLEEIDIVLRAAAGSADASSAAESSADESEPIRGAAAGHERLNAYRVRPAVAEYSAAAAAAVAAHEEATQQQRGETDQGRMRSALGLGGSADDLAQLAHGLASLVTAPSLATTLPAATPQLSPPNTHPSHPAVLLPLLAACVCS